ncbi:MAG: DUF4349 domain-containing protein, partial [Gaiellales bacterium]
MSSPEGRDEHVVDALLDGGALLADPIRMAAVLDELRARKPEPAAALRGRVAELLAAPVTAPRRHRIPAQRRVVGALALVGACALVVAVALSLAGGGGSTRVASVPGATDFRAANTGGFAGTVAPAPQSGAQPAGVVPAPSATRLQDYRASMALRVSGTRRLSQVTQRTISLTRGFGGYVTRSNVDLHGRSGSAQVDVRVPVARVQDAIARFSSLGVITGQHVAVADLQAGYDAAERRIESLRHSLALIEIRLAAPKMTPEQHVTLLAQRERAQHALAGARETSQGLAQRGAYARIDLSFATGQKAAPVVAQKPGRLEHAVRRAGGLLETVTIGALFVAILGLPVLLVAALVLYVARSQRRRR